MAQILIMDDDKMALSFISKLLQSMGHQTQEALDGRIGLDLMSEQSFDLVITDIVMPEMEGLEVIIEIRKQHPNMKIIAISGGGTGDTNYLKHAKALGADDAVPKPFTKEELIDAVENCLK